jgi:hypothetical protein
MGANAMQINFSSDITIQSIKKNLVQYIAGSVTLAVVAALVFGLVTFIFLKLIGKKQGAKAD